MNRIFHILLCLVCAASLSMASAQDRPRKFDPAKRVEFAKAQAEHIAKDLKLNDATASEFKETYMKYQEEMWQLAPRNKKPKKIEDMTEDEAKAENLDRLEGQKKMYDLKKKYYELYKKFLTQKQILELQQIERKQMERMFQHQGRPEGHRGGNRNSAPRGHNPR